MSPIQRTPTSLHLRFSLGFTNSGNERGPYVVWVHLDLVNNQNFHLEPLRLRSTGAVAEWFLAENSPVKGQLEWRFDPLHGPFY